MTQDAPGVAPGGDQRALGEALAARVHECAAEAQRRLAASEWIGKPASERFWATRQDALLIANMLVARWLITGEGIDSEEARWLAERGTVAAAEELSIVNVTRSYLCWRDVLCSCLEEEAARLRSPQDLLHLALASVRASADASIMRMARAFDAETERLREALRAQREDYRHQALHDPLSGIPNRVLLLDRLQQAIQSARRSGERVALLMIDLDRFKQVNDRHGHHVGDQVLRALAERLLAGVRGSDTVARLGGDEFAVVLPRCPDLDSALAMGAKIVRSLREPVMAGGGEIVVGGSVGVALYPDHAGDRDGLLRAADLAMYRAKRAERLPDAPAADHVALPG